MIFAVSEDISTTFTDESKKEVLVSAEQHTLYSEVAGLKVAQKTLANGLTVVAVNQPSAPRVLVDIVYRGVGSSIEADGEKGFAHLLEHMVFKGTPTLGESGFYDIANQYGAKTNASTFFDWTRYYVEVDKNNWKPFLHLYADCLRNALFDSEHLASEVKAVVKELRRNEDNPMWILPQEFIRTSVGLEHPHHGVIVGYKKDLADVTSKKLKDFFSKYYDPALATLFLVGDLGNLDDAVAAAEKEMGVIERKNVELPRVFEKKYDVKIGFHNILQDECSYDTILLGWHLPGGMNSIATQAEMVQDILSSGDNSLLVKRLVHDEKVANWVAASFWIAGGKSYFFIFCTPLEGQTEKCVQLIHDELAKLVESGGEENFASIRSMGKLSHALWLEGLANSSSGISYLDLSRYVLSQNLDDCFNNEKNLQQVTPDDIKLFAKTYLCQDLSSRVDRVPLKEGQHEVRVQKLAQEQILEEQIFAAHARTAPFVKTGVPSEYPPAEPIVVAFPRADEQAVLSNGLRVFAIQDTASDICSFRLKHRDEEHFATSIDEIILNILGDMLLQGFPGLTREEIERKFTENGVRVSISGTSIALTSLKHTFYDSLNFLARIILSAEFSEENLAKFKAQKIAALKQSKDDAISVARQIRRQRLYPNTVFDWSYDDAIARVESLDVNTLNEYFSRYFDPRFMTCSAVGNFDPHSFINFLDETFHDMPSKGEPVKPFESVKALPGNIDVSLLRDQVVIMYARQSPITLTHEDYPAILVASEIMYARAFNLREETGLFYIVGSRLAQGDGLLDGVDWIRGHTGPEFLPKAHECFDKFIKKDMRKAIEPDDLEGAKCAVRSDLAAMACGAYDKANYFIRLDSCRIDSAFYERVLAKINALTAEEVTAAVERYLDAGGDFVRVQVGNIPA